MRDSIYESYGFGCHCRNCQFRVTNTHCESICRRGVFVPQNITTKSFCSEGLPTYVKVNRFGEGVTANIAEKAINELRKCVLEKNPEELYYIELRMNWESEDYSRAWFENRDLNSVCVGCLEEHQLPKSLRRYMTDESDCHNVPVDLFIKEFNRLIDTYEIHEH